MGVVSARGRARMLNSEKGEGGLDLNGGVGGSMLWGLVI